MPYSKPAVLLRVIGSFGPNGTNALEEWSCSWRIDYANGSADEAKKLALLQTLLTPFTTFQQTPAVGAHQWAFMQKLTAAYIGTDGKYLGGAAQDTTELAFPAPREGVSTLAASWDVARVYTLRTALGRGRGHVGRFYWPCAAAVTSSGIWADPDVQNAANAAGALLNAINSAAVAQWGSSSGVAIYSKIGEVTNRVIRVEVGHAPDTQRRRTKSLLEDYKGMDLAGAAVLREEKASQSYD